MQKYWRDYAGLFSIAGPVVVLDQLSKAWIRRNLALGEVYHPEWQLSSFARLVHANNTGAAFGVFQNLSGVFTVLPIIISAAILYYLPRIPRQDWVVRLAMGLYLGGALGNLIDRLAIGHVTDFISVGGFAIFNLADACISLGATLFVLGVLLREKRLHLEIRDT